MKSEIKLGQKVKIKNTEVTGTVISATKTLSGHDYYGVLKADGSVFSMYVEEIEVLGNEEIQEEKQTKKGSKKAGKKATAPVEEEEEQEEMIEEESPYNSDDSEETEDDDDFAGMEEEEDEKPKAKTVEDLRKALVDHAQIKGKPSAYAILAKFKTKSGEPAKKANEVGSKDIEKAIKMLTVKK